MLFDLSRLTEFNRALVYTLKPESSEERQNGSILLKDCLFPEMAQHQDLFLGYMYAQKVILPFIESKGVENITIDVFLNWIKTLHKFMGKSLLENQGDGPSGVYTSEEVFRWNPSTKVQSYIKQYMECVITKKDLAEVLKENFDIKKEDTLAFAEVLARVKQLPDNVLWNWQLQNLDPSKDNGLFIWMKKLYAAYHRDALTLKEKAAVDNIATICVPPDQLESLMQDYAKKTIRLWQVCNPKDIDSLSQFLSETFYGLTRIHPFVNANGRTATCLINIILRSFKLPSILIREPSETEDKHSNYSKAMSCIVSTRKPFADHIKERLLKASRQPFSDPDLEILITKRVELMVFLKMMVMKYPIFNIDREMRALQGTIFPQKTFSKEDLQKTKVQVDIVSAILQGFQKRMASLESPKPQISEIKDSFFNSQSMNKALKIAAAGLVLAAGAYCYTRR